MLSQPLRIGDRIILSGGYSREPPWLHGRRNVTGHVLCFVSRGGPRDAAIVRLDDQLSSNGRFFDLVALHLRYKDAQWRQKEVVHVELLERMPNAHQDKEERVWVESHAQYEVLR